MNTYLQRRWGGGGTNPTETELREALAELETPDNEHPDCWLEDENSWAISANRSGTVVLENSETGEGPWHLTGLERNEIIELWQLLQSGNFAALRANPWVEGYQPKQC